MKQVTTTLVVFVMGLALLPGAAFSGPFNGMHPLQSDRLSIGIGAYWPDISGYYEIDDPDGGDGSNVDLDDDAGLDDNEVQAAASLTWRLSNNTRIQGEYFDVDLSAKNTISRDLNIGDLEFEAGASLKTDYDMDIARAFFGYSFVKNDTMELGAGVGLHYISLDFSVKGKAYIGDTPLLEAERSIDEWAIVPNVGGYANYAFSPKWLVGARVDWMSADVDDYDGTLWNAEAHVQYQMFDHFGVGLAYRYLDFELAANDRKSGDWRTEVEYGGPVLFFTANF